MDRIKEVFAESRKSYFLLRERRETRIKELKENLIEIETAATENNHYETGNDEANMEVKAE